jgi:hypothetical protein
MTRELYVYFRAASSRSDAVWAAAADMQARLRGEIPGLQARLLRRLDASGGHDTWMETYAMEPAVDSGGVSATLGSAIEQRAAAWSNLLDGPRHVEVFGACA